MNPADEWSLAFHQIAREDIEGADGSIRQRISTALRQLKAAPEERSKVLSGSLQGARSYRFGTPAGEYRVLLRLNRETKLIKIYCLGPRENFYERVQRLLD